MKEIVINGKTIKLPCEIKVPLFEKQPIIIQHDRYIAVVTENCQKDGRNVFVFDKNGKLLWQMSKDIAQKYSFSSYSSKKNNIYDNLAYIVDASFNGNGQLVLWNSDGFKLYIDPETGKIISDEFVK